MPALTFEQATRIALTVKYATFTGRGPRSEYWWFSVFFVGAAVIIGAISIGTDTALVTALMLPLISPMRSASVRRLHDTSRSGWWMFIALVPLVGPFIYLTMVARDSTQSINRFGPFANALENSHTRVN